MEFKVGEKVRWGEHIGTIVVILGRHDIGIDFGINFDGHKLNGRINTETGWYVTKKYIERCKNTNLINY